MQAGLGQPVVVENRPGAGATIGGAAVARAEPDGHSVLVALIAKLVAPLLMPQQPYDSLRDFRAVGLLAMVPTVLVVRPDFPARDVAERSRAVAAAPGRFSYASGGVGALQRLAAELHHVLTGAEAQHVPFNGSAPAMTEVLAGRVDDMFADLPVAARHVAAGTVRALAVGTRRRVPALPDVPTMAEALLPGFEAAGFVMWWVPSGTSDAAVARLNAAGNAALRQPDVQERARLSGFLLEGGTPAAAAEFLSAEAVRWGRVVRERRASFAT